jgi:hypothetical protein
MAVGNGQASSNERLQGWERVPLVLFAGFFAGIDVEPTALANVLRVIAWLAILAAVGVVEIVMALYCRTRRARQGNG